MREFFIVLPKESHQVCKEGSTQRSTGSPLHKALPNHFPYLYLLTLGKIR